MCLSRPAREQAACTQPLYHGPRAHDGIALVDRIALVGGFTAVYRIFTAAALDTLSTSNLVTSTLSTSTLVTSTRCR